MDPDRTRLLDELAANATAAGPVQLVGGWMLRAAPHLPFRRSSSVLVRGEPGGDPEAAIDLAEAFARRHAIVPRFQLGADPSARDLDARLAARGYAVEAPVTMMVADAAVVADRTDPVAPGVTVATERLPAGPAPYAAAVGDDDRARARAEGYVRMLGEVGPAAFAVRAAADGVPAGVGFAVVERGWLGVFGMTTAAPARRRGVARAVLAALVALRSEHDGHGVYLQVEADNAGARALYTGAGFAAHHGYHYRTGSVPPA